MQTNFRVCSINNNIRNTQKQQEQEPQTELELELHRDDTVTTSSKFDPSI